MDEGARSHDCGRQNEGQRGHRRLISGGIPRCGLCIFSGFKGDPNVWFFFNYYLKPNKLVSL